MSGGSMNYLYSQLEDAKFRENTPGRIALRLHLDKLAKALKAVEWNDSGDGDDDEDDFIRDCLAPGIVLAATIGEARSVLKALKHEIEIAEKFIFGHQKEKRLSKDSASNAKAKIKLRPLKGK